MNKCLQCLIEDSTKSFSPWKISFFFPDTLEFFTAAREMRGFPIHLHKGNQNITAHDIWQISAAQAVWCGLQKRPRRGGRGLRVAWDSSHARVCPPTVP